ncbi:hypothetical protein SAMN05216232_3765 [Virgibacillus subterraneus]|uniref:Cxxc_20_cxxc protein n=1 Tax=Virgibacillus subterraneus TaxID=621109 RepID=A0A1H9K6X9_9BACI|nr:hypothetical protein SAMN05216232_3765 [Virgibacillus subterraneus]
MKLPKCNVCKHQFWRGKINTSLWFSNRAIQCSVCGTKLEIASRSRHFVIRPLYIVVGVLLIFLLGILSSLFLPFLVNYNLHYTTGCLVEEVIELNRRKISAH